MKLNSAFQPKEIEENIRSRWKTLDVQNHIHRAMKDKVPVGYVEGPPTMNGEPHIGHIRGRILKDLWYRFSTLNGSNIVFRAGWDTQGLPVELQAEKELGLSGSKAENLRSIGEDVLVDTCKRIITKYNRSWRESDLLLGMCFDYKKAYWTYRDEYIEREWKYVEQAWMKGLLGEGYRVVAYCPSCQTSLSHAEVVQGYETVEDPSLYFKMKVRDEDAFLILWTTMPFTVVTDEMVAVQPDAEYAYVMTGGETWIVATQRLEALMNELAIKEYSILKTVKGSALQGKKYVHPLMHHIPGQERFDKHTYVHTIVAEDFVDTTTGSGLVHMSPANGEEDFQIAKKRNVPIFNPIDDQVRFTEESGMLAGLFVRDADAKVVDLLKKEGMVLRIDRIIHEYPTCWRSHHKLVWLARREYFYWVDRLGDLAVKAAEKAEYFYDSPRNRFIEIVKEKVPWCISRERVWGTPLPIWICSSCGHKVGAFSRAEIVANAANLPDGPDFELHRPWIDRITLKCPSCNGQCLREPFVFDTWHNSGASPYASFTDAEHHDLVPVEFLTEGIDQTRGWAYTLLIENVILTGKAEAPFKAFLFQGHVLDTKGNKMSKSLGNIVEGKEALSKYSVDVLRFYMIWKVGPIENINLDFEEMKTRPYQVLNTLYHMHLYFIQNSAYDHFDETKHGLERAEHKDLLKPQEKWLLSKLQSLNNYVCEGYAKCRYHDAARALESFIIEDFSQVYVPMIRGEIWDDRPETLDRRLAIYATLSYVLKSLDIFLHPISPYVTEYLNYNCFEENSVTILLDGWPEVDSKYIDPSLVEDFQLLVKLVSMSNAARMKAKLKRRWPLKRAEILLSARDAARIIEYERLLSDLSNVKEVIVTSDVKNTSISLRITPKFDLLGPKLKSEMPRLVSKIAAMDSLTVIDELRAKGSVDVTLKERIVKIVESELVIEYASNRDAVVVEKDGLVLALSVERDDDLIKEGMIRDIARRLQTLRKERGYNPTDILGSACITGLDKSWVAAIDSRRSELAYLVRVKKINLMDEPVKNISWSNCEIDGTIFKISVEQ